MKKQSAGLLVYCRNGKKIEVLLGHAGGPFWSRKDKGAWTIPKGEFEDGEPPLDAAKREFSEELGKPAPQGETVELGSVKRSDGKIIHVWAVEADVDISTISSNTFAMEWPPKSGHMQEFPEIDRAGWFDITKAAAKLHQAQDVFLRRLARQLDVPIDVSHPPEQSSLF